jgi:hypothetical protein
MTNNLHNVASLDLLIELSRRTIERQHGANAILSLLQLVGAMSAVLGTLEPHRIANQCRDLADALELKEHVGVQQ